MDPSTGSTVGETAAASIVLKNTGLKAWNSQTRLATTGPRDRASPFAGPDWLAPHRLAGVNGAVAPGDTFRFEFTFRAPSQPGDYSEHFGLTQEGVAWFGDPGQGGPPDEQLEAHLVVLPAAGVDAGPATADAGPTRPDASAPAGPDGSTPAGPDGGGPRRDGSLPAPGSDASSTPSAAPDAASSLGAIEVTGGCGCQAGASGPGLLLFSSVLALVAASRRRRAPGLDGPCGIASHPHRLERHQPTGQELVQDGP